MSGIFGDSEEVRGPGGGEEEIKNKQKEKKGQRVQEHQLLRMNLDFQFWIQQL
jgi:hypothetical protein